MSLHAPPPSRMARISYYLGPFALLSVVTSVAFNRAMLARERGEQRRLHELQMSLLNQLQLEASSIASSSTTSIFHSLQEQKKLARRMRALQLDPLRLGFSRQVLASPEEEEKLQRARNATTSWGSALFGSGTASKLRESIGKATQAIREQGFGPRQVQTSTSEEDEADAAWVRALEESIESEERGTKVEVDRTTTQHEPVTWPSLREPEVPVPERTPVAPEHPSQSRRRVYA